RASRRRPARLRGSPRRPRAVSAADRRGVAVRDGLARQLPGPRSEAREPVGVVDRVAASRRARLQRRDYLGRHVDGRRGGGRHDGGAREAGARGGLRSRVDLQRAAGSAERARRARRLHRSGRSGPADAASRARARRLGCAARVGRVAARNRHPRAALRPARPRAARLTMDATRDDAVKVRRSARVLLSASDVAAIYDRMAASITPALAERDPIVLAVMNGGVFTAIELCKRFDFPYEFAYVHATRYANTTAGGTLDWHVEPRPELEGRAVLVVDDILDAGLTLAALERALRER